MSPEKPEVPKVPKPQRAKRTKKPEEDKAIILEKSKDEFGGMYGGIKSQNVKGET